MRFPFRSSCWAAVITVAVAQCAVAQEVICDFDDLPLGPESKWNGDDLSGKPETVPDPYNPPFGELELYHGGFTSGGVTFHNTYNATWFSWEGWAYSNMTDTTSPGHGNQYSAITGADMSPSQNPAQGNFAVGYCPSNPATPIPELPYMSIDKTVGYSFQGMHITNTTYAALSMETGDQFAKKFGGDDGNDPDWMLLTVYGENSNGELLTDGGGEPISTTKYMADYRPAGTSQDYILTDWSYVDLASLSEASKLYFRLTSSDTGAFGMNTPGYFAVDNISTAPTVSEPTDQALQVRWGKETISTGEVAWSEPVTINGLVDGGTDDFTDAEDVATNVKDIPEGDWGIYSIDLREGSSTEKETLSTDTRNLSSSAVVTLEGYVNGTDEELLNQYDNPDVRNLIEFTDVNGDFPETTILRSMGGAHEQGFNSVIDGEPVYNLGDILAGTIGGPANPAPGILVYDQTVWGETGYPDIGGWLSGGEAYYSPNGQEFQINLAMGQHAPEPSTFALLCIGALGWLPYARRKR